MSATDSASNESDASSNSMNFGAAAHEQGGVSNSGLPDLSNVPPTLLIELVENLGRLVGSSNWSDASKLALLVSSLQSDSSGGATNEGNIFDQVGGQISSAPAVDIIAHEQGGNSTTASSTSQTSIESQGSSFVFKDTGGLQALLGLGPQGDSVESATQNPSFSLWADLLDAYRPSGQAMLGALDSTGGAFNSIAASSLAESPTGAS